VVIYGLLLVLGAAFALPFVWLATTSLKTEANAYVIPPNLIPNPLIWENYQVAIFGFPLLRSTAVTMYILVGAMVGTILTASLTAFGFARLRFPGRDVLFVLVLSTMMIPYYVELIPQYLLFRMIGWVDTPLPLIVPAYFGGGAFYIFLLRQFFMSIPIDLDEAARIDGANYLRVFWQILIPLSIPVTATAAVLTFMAQWNEFLYPFIYLNTKSKYTLAIGIRYFQAVAGFADETEPKYHLLMAASVMMTAPIIILFFLAQRYLVQGIVMSGIKG
jgi:multiple sugar transport system permease protein